MRAPYRVDVVAGRSFINQSTGARAPQPKNHPRGGRDGHRRAQTEVVEEKAVTSTSARVQDDEVSLSIQVDTVLHRFLIGKQSKPVASRLSEFSSAKVAVFGDQVEITGSKTDANQARNFLRNYVEEEAPSLESTPLTHFLCVSLVTNEITASYEAWKAKVLGDGNVSEQLFARPTRLHLTLSMLKIFSKETMGNAVEVMKRFESSTGPLKVSLDRLALMKGSEEKARVLYSCVGGEDREVAKLQSLCDGLKEAFEMEGLFVSNPGEPVKLHCTLMNVRWCRGAHAKRHFEASQILSDGLALGQTTIEDVKLVSFTRMGPDDFYAVESSVRI